MGEVILCGAWDVLVCGATPKAARTRWSSFAIDGIVPRQCFGAFVALWK